MMKVVGLSFVNFPGKSPLLTVKEKYKEYMEQNTRKRQYHHLTRKKTIIPTAWPHFHSPLFSGG